MGAPTIADKIMDVFIQNPNVEIPIAKIRAEAGTQRDGKPFSENQVQTAIGNLRNRGNVPISTVVAGRVYRYDPGARKAVVADGNQKQLFESITTLKNGDILIQDESGTVYRAVELS